VFVCILNQLVHYNIELFGSESVKLPINEKSECNP
jgi:hypothetical protein